MLLKNASMMALTPYGLDDLWPDVKKENMEAFVKTVKEYGAKASPAVKRI